MSSKKSKSQRLSEQQRKREARANKAFHRKDVKGESYFADDETYQSFAKQLHVLGLVLREIPGDGNCLFRALADQVEGGSHNHLYYRAETVDYMIAHRDDFEPFIETDNMPFQQYVSQLRKPGTYAGNDAIVAFARNHKCNIVIHQLNAPIYQIIGSEHPYSRELHISYHNGDHYASIRRIGDVSQCAANIKFMPSCRGPHNMNGVGPAAAAAVAAPVCSSKSDGARRKASKAPPERAPTPVDVTTIYPDENTGEVKAVRDWKDVRSYIMAECGNHDEEEVHEALVDNLYDVDTTIAYLLQLQALRAESDPTTVDTTSTVGVACSGGAVSSSSSCGSVGGAATPATPTTVSTVPTAPTVSTVSGGGCKEADQWSRASSSGYSSLSSNSPGAAVAAGGARPKVRPNTPLTHQPSPHQHLTNRQRKHLARQEKKRRQDERHKQQHNHDTLSPLPPANNNNNNDLNADALLNDIQCLNI